jgi:hypothetical protein
LKRHLPSPAAFGRSLDASSLRKGLVHFGTQSCLKSPLPRSVAQGLDLDALCPWERRARFGVGLGCPSFGGQRTVGSRFSFPPAELGKRSKPVRVATALQCLRSRSQLVVRVAPGAVLPLGPIGPNETATIPVRHSRAPAVQVAASKILRPSALGWRVSVGASPAPNHSVKGTSCADAQAAPYLER